MHKLQVDMSKYSIVDLAVSDCSDDDLRLLSQLTRLHATAHPSNTGGGAETFDLAASSSHIASPILQTSVLPGSAGFSMSGTSGKSASWSGRVKPRRAIGVTHDTHILDSTPAASTPRVAAVAGLDYAKDV